MDTLNYDHSRLDAIVPGVSAAYAQLRQGNDKGLYTSAGAFYNHTFFARDAATATRMTGPFDHEVIRQAILALAEFQGSKHRQATQEAPGRIHHEWRNFHMWQSGFVEKNFMRYMSLLWGGTLYEFTTYFAADTTALYIKLVGTYARDVDAAIINHTIKNRDGARRTVGASVALAADWIMSCIDDGSIVAAPRTNRRSLPFQAYQDSFTAYPRTDRSLARYKRPLAFLETQALSVDALRAAAQLLPDHPRAQQWHHASNKIAANLLQSFWMQEAQYFASVLDKNPQDAWQQTDILNISAGWILNTSVFHTLGNAEREKFIAPLVRRLFSNEFLTTVGLRTRSVAQPQPLGHNTIDYHGAYTVWPMFTYMVAEGLRYHHMVGLAEQLENRILNGINMDGHFPEFHIVLDDGRVAQSPLAHHKGNAMGIQMNPEHNIAFTVVPAMSLAHQVLYPQSRPTPRDWQRTLEADILQTIPKVELCQNKTDLTAAIPVANVHLSRALGVTRSLKYMMKQKGQ